MMQTMPWALVMSVGVVVLSGCNLTGKKSSDDGEIPAQQRPFVAAADNAEAVIEVLSSRAVRQVLPEQDFYVGAPDDGIAQGSIEEDDQIPLESDIGSGEMDLHVVGTSVFSQPTGAVLMTDVFVTATFPVDTFVYLFAADGSLAAQTLVPSGTTFTINISGQDTFSATNHNQSFSSSTSFSGVTVTSPIDGNLVTTVSTGTMNLNGQRDGYQGVLGTDQWTVDANSTNTITGIGDILLDQHYILYELAGVRYGNQAVAYPGAGVRAYDYSLYPPDGSDVPDPLVAGYQFGFF